MNKIPLTPLAIFSLIAAAIPAHGVEYQSPRTLALGGAGRAGPLLTDAIYLNPAYASFAPVYSLFAGLTRFDEGRVYNVSVQDSRTEMLQAGVGYTKRDRNTAINIGASKRAFQQLGFGLGTKLILDNVTSKVTSDAIFSTSFIALPWAYTALVIDNIFEGNEQRARGLYRTIHPSFKFIPTQQVELYVDPFYSPSYPYGKKSGYQAGFEFGLLADFYLRVGKFQDAEVAHLGTRGSGFGWGFGWLGPRVNFEYALSRTLETHSGPAFSTAHAFDMTIFI